MSTTPPKPQVMLELPEEEYNTLRDAYLHKNELLARTQEQLSKVEAELRGALEAKAVCDELLRQRGEAEAALQQSLNAVQNTLATQNAKLDAQTGAYTKVSADLKMTEKKLEAAEMNYKNEINAERDRAFTLRGELENLRAEFKVYRARSIELSPSEVQSKLDRVRWAELLIAQLPSTHNGRNSWLLNYARDPSQYKNQPASVVTQHAAVHAAVRPVAAKSNLSAPYGAGKGVQPHFIVAEEAPSATEGPGAAQATGTNSAAALSAALRAERLIATPQLRWRQDPGLSARLQQWWRDPAVASNPEQEYGGEWREVHTVSAVGVVK